MPIVTGFFVVELIMFSLIGDLKTSATAICFQRAQEGTSILSFDVTPPTANRNSLIIGTPVYFNGSEKESNDLIGVVMLEVDSSPINMMMAEKKA